MKESRLNEAMVLIDRAKELVGKSFRKLDYLLDELGDVAGYLDDLNDEIDRVTTRWDDEDNAGEDDTDTIPLESEAHKYDFDTLEERDGKR